MRLSASRLHLRWQTVHRFLLAPRAFCLLWALSSTGPGPSRKLMSGASQKNRSIRSLQTVKARTLLAEAHQGISTCGRLMLVDCLRNGMLTSHYRGVSCLVFSDDGSLLISGSEDGGIRILLNIVFPTIIDAVALDPGENVFFAGGRDVKIYVAALNARAHLTASMGSISSIVSRITAVTCLAYGISGTEDGVVRVWDARTHDILRMFKHAKGPVNNILVV